MTTYPDVEKSLAAWAKTVPGVVGSGTVFKGAQLPFVRIGKLGGPRGDVTDNPQVDIDVFAATRDQAFAIADEISERLKPRTRAGDAIIDTVRTPVSPRQLPWSNDDIKRVSATYALGLRR
jgi:hypothetical protein